MEKFNRIFLDIGLARVAVRERDGEIWGVDFLPRVASIASMGANLGGFGGGNFGANSRGNFGANLGENPLLLLAREQILAYFNGRLKEFDLPLHAHDFSPFSARAYATLLDIPYGTTLTYKEFARDIYTKFNSKNAQILSHKSQNLNKFKEQILRSNFMPKLNSYRAAGNANARNPYPIIIPCHRVVASDGIGGYSGKENLIAIKRYLLNLEQKYSQMDIK